MGFCPLSSKTLNFSMGCVELQNLSGFSRRSISQSRVSGVAKNLLEVFPLGKPILIREPVFFMKKGDTSVKGLIKMNKSKGAPCRRPLTTLRQ